jgi:predicted HicB family RNase H-like nuclease
MATMKANTAPQVTTLRIGISPKTKRIAVRLARDRGISLNELFIELFKAIIKKQKTRNVVR